MCSMSFPCCCCCSVRASASTTGSRNTSGSGTSSNARVTRAPVEVAFVAQRERLRFWTFSSAHTVFTLYLLKAANEITVNIRTLQNFISMSSCCSTDWNTGSCKGWCCYPNLSAKSWCFLLQRKMFSMQKGLGEHAISMYIPIPIPIPYPHLLFHFLRFLIPLLRLLSWLHVLVHVIQTNSDKDISLWMIRLFALLPTPLTLFILLSSSSDQKRRFAYTGSDTSTVLFPPLFPSLLVPFFFTHWFSRTCKWLEVTWVENISHFLSSLDAIILNDLVPGQFSVYQLVRSPVSSSLTVSSWLHTREPFVMHSMHISILFIPFSTDVPSIGWRDTELLIFLLLMTILSSKRASEQLKGNRRSPSTLIWWWVFSWKETDREWDPAECKDGNEEGLSWRLMWREWK